MRQESFRRKKDSWKERKNEMEEIRREENEAIDLYHLMDAGYSYEAAMRIIIKQDTNS